MERRNRCGNTTPKGKLLTPHPPDLHVVAGYKYYYVARAVNLKDQESKYSKQVEATIP
jgi:hypothetical protein